MAPAEERVIGVVVYALTEAEVESEGKPADQVALTVEGERILPKINPLIIFHLILERNDHLVELCKPEPQVSLGPLI